MLRRKQLGSDDPLSNLGIMTMENNYSSLPYKKPILKFAPPSNINTKSVLRELSRDFGGVTTLRSNSSHLNHDSK